MVGPYQCSSQARSTISCRLISRPGSVARHSRMANSFGVSATSTPAHGHLPRPQVDGERPVPEHLGGRAAARPLAAAEHGADPGEQLGEPERLDQVVVGALVKREHAVGLLAARGHHDDRGVGIRAEPAAHVHAVHVGQPEVEQNHVGPRPP